MEVAVPNSKQGARILGNVAFWCLSLGVFRTPAPDRLSVLVMTRGGKGEPRFFLESALRLLIAYQHSEVTTKK
jgi:hypothetical protein